MLLALVIMLNLGTPMPTQTINDGAVFFNPSLGQYGGISQGVYTPVGQGSQALPSTIIGGSDSGSVNGASITPQQTAQQQQAATDAKAKADTVNYLNDQMGQVRSLLGRTDTALNQGLQNNDNLYNTGVGQATQQKDQAVTTQNQGKLSTYDTINRNANQGYRSLSQILGRAGGSGSSAYQELLPNVIGEDTSAQRKGATDTFGQNLSAIDGSFQSTLSDLLNKKKANEESLRSGVEGQRQNLNGTLSSLAQQLATANGGDYASAKAAAAPYQSAIENSRNAVENFFNQYFTPYQAQDLNPNLAQYQTDRASVNAGNAGPADASNPYASLLRKRLQGAA